MNRYNCKISITFGRRKLLRHFTKYQIMVELLYPVSWNLSGNLGRQRIDIPISVIQGLVSSCCGHSW